MEIVVIVVILVLILVAIGFAGAATENAAKRKVTEAVNRHMSTLVLRRTQLLMVDPYGTVRAEKWTKEVEYFFNTQISGTLSNSQRDAAKRKWPQTAQFIETLVASAADKMPAFSDVPVAQMKPFEFENYCAVRLQRAGWTARATKASGDQGVDVIAEKRGTRLVLQCKLYSKPIGNKAVQEVAAGRTHYGARFAAVVSNNSYTPSAQQLANTTNVLLLHYTQLDDLNRTLGIEEQTPAQEPPLEAGNPSPAPYGVTAAEPPLPVSEEKALEEDERKDLETASGILGLPLDQKRCDRWRKDRAALLAMGLDFRLQVVPAMQQAVLKAAERGKCLQITSLMWFEIPAKRFATVDLPPPPVVYDIPAPRRSSFGQRR